MKVLVLGADGYLGWPTCLHFAARGHMVLGIDNYIKRWWEYRFGSLPLFPVKRFESRAVSPRLGKMRSHLETRVLDLTNHRMLYELMEEFKPDTIIHYAEQPSAPMSMAGRDAAVETQQNNVIGTLNLLFCIAKHCPDAHLIKLGTMGEYGTPPIDIEEGWLRMQRADRPNEVYRAPFPKQPGSFYHASKVHDSTNIQLACRAWGLRATDLHQGVVYGMDTPDNPDPTSFHYDAVFGTVLNRFIAQAALGVPLTVYGTGEQIRGFLDIRDTLACVELATANPANAGEYRVFNQFTEQFSIMELAKKVQRVTGAKIDHVKNPRVEDARHYYNAKHTRLKDLGLKPHLLSDDLIDTLWQRCKASNFQIDVHAIRPQIPWRLH